MIFFLWRMIYITLCVLLLHTRNQALHSRLGPIIRDVEAFGYKTEIKIIYFVPLCLIVWFMVYSNPKFLIFKTKKRPQLFFLRLEAVFFFDPMLSRKAFATNSLK